MDSKNIFITGGTGLFGSTLIEHYLIHEPDTRFYALARGDNNADTRNRLLDCIKNSPTFPQDMVSDLSDRVTVMKGDFTDENLGLPSSSIQELQNDITDIIHSGASVDFGLPLDEARNINVGGTKHMINFALGCRQLQSFLHISTGHVAGKRSGTIMENEIGTDQGFLNSYEQTKAEAELLVHKYMDSIPITIHRLTTVIGDRESGHIRQFGFFHNSVRLLSQSFIPYLAGDKNVHLDMIPTEYPVEALRYLHRKNFQPGTTYHICCGPEKSFMLEDFLQETVEYFKIKMKNPLLTPPEIISREEFEKRIARSNSARLTAVMHALSTFIGHLSLPKVFDRTNANRDLAGSGIDAPAVRSYYFKILDECIRRKFGKL
jgi:thioester reductase-like protein